MTHLQLLLDLLLQIINLPHDRALRIIYKDYDSSFSQHFEVSNESTIPIKNVEVLITGIHKFLDDLSPRIINDIFQKSENYFLKFSYLVSKRKFTTTYGIDIISFKDPQIWQDVLKTSKALFIKPITAWCCFSIPPENIRKPKGFLMFSGGIEKATLGCNGLNLFKSNMKRYRTSTCH